MKNLFSDAESFFELVIKNEKESVRTDVKFLLDISFSVFFDQFDLPEGDKYIQNLTPAQADQIITWFSKYYIPFYESFEDFEKCARLKSAINRIKVLRNIK